MALQNSRVQQAADRAADLANQLANLNSQINRFIELNSDLNIDWGAGEKPAYIDEEANGNLSGRAFSRQDVSNAIYSLSLIRSLLGNEDMSGAQGDHLGNINKLANP